MVTLGPAVEGVSKIFTEAPTIDKVQEQLGKFNAPWAVAKYGVPKLADGGSLVTPPEETEHGTRPGGWGPGGVPGGRPRGASPGGVPGGRPRGASPGVSVRRTGGGMCAYTEGGISVYRGGSIPYSHFACVCVRRILNCIFYIEVIQTVFLYRSYSSCIFYIESIQTVLLYRRYLF